MLLIKTNNSSDIVIRLECLHPDFGFDGLLQELKTGAVTAIHREDFADDFVEWVVSSKTGGFQITASGAGNQPKVGPGEKIEFRVTVKHAGNVAIPRPPQTRPTSEKQEAMSLVDGKLKAAMFLLGIAKVTK